MLRSNSGGGALGVGIYLSIDKVFDGRDVAHLVTCANARPAARFTPSARFLLAPTLVLALSLVLGLAGVVPAQAQPIIAGDLTGSWFISQISTPASPFTPSAVRSFSGTVTLSAGLATSGSLRDDLGSTFTITGGTLTVTAGGVVGGSLTLDDGLATPNLSLDVAEARLLLTRHAIIGVSTILSNPGFVTMVRREPGQTLTIPADLTADWNYHELTPSNDIAPLPPAAAGDASWVKGTITFHQLPDAPNGCSEADLALADGTVRAQRNGDPQSFGCATLGAGGVESAVTGTNASFVTRLTTDAAGTSGNRDLILGLTDDPTVGAPGLVLMSRITPSPPAGFFAQTDLAGPWRVYLHRVESARQGSTWQAGTTTFTGAGTFGGGTLEDLNATTTALTTGSLLVSANGSVSGTLSAGATALADQYVIKGALRATKDVVTGVVTARVNARTQTFYGLLTMVREATVFDLGQSTYNVTEGGTATITVLRSGNRTGANTVHFDASGGTAPLADYQAASGILTFAPNAPSATFTVKTIANPLVDGNRSVNLVLSAPTGGSALLGTTATGVLNIVDEDKAGTVKLGQPAYSVSEAGKNVAIVIQRSLGAAAGVVVQFATTDGTAEAGVDYTATNGSVTFAAGEISKTVMVPIAETTIVDGSRSFTFALTGATPPSTVVGTPASALVTIGDNDVAGSVQFKFPAYVVDEGGTALITVTRTGGAAGGVLVTFATSDGSATAPADYAAQTGILTFLPGNTSATFSVPTATDTIVEGDETVLLTLSNPQGGASLGAQKTAVLTIKDGQKGVQFSAPTYSATESAASAMVTVSRTGPMADTATVRYSTSDGTARAGVNYKPTSGTLTFAPNITKATFTVPLLPDKQVKGPQTVLLLLSNPTSTALGPLSSAVLTLGDVDVAGAVKLASATFSISEAAASAVITVSRSGGTAGGVTVDFATADQPCGSPPCPGKAQAGFDYQAVNGTLTFGPAETTKTVLIPITNDNQVNGNRAFVFTLGNAQGGGTLATPSTAVVTINDDDKGGVIQFGAATFTANEPTAVTPTAVPITITRTGTNLAGGATAVFSTANGTGIAGTDYTAIATTVVFGQGETIKTVAVPILFDGVEDGNKTVLLSLASPGGGATLGTTATAVLTIIDSTPSTRLSAASYGVNEGGAAAITVIRGGPTNGTVKVGYAASDNTAVAGTDYKPTSGVLTFNPGVGALTFTVPTFKTVGDDGSRAFNVTLSQVLGGPPVIAPSGAVVTISDVDPPGTFQFSAATFSATEGGIAPAVTVTRTGGSGGTVVIRWTVNEGASTATSPGTAGADYGPATTGLLTFGPAVTSLKLPLTIVNDTVAEDPETVVMSLSIESAPAGAALGAQTTTTLTILDNDNGGTIQFAAASQTVAESVAGGKANLIVSRTGTNLASGVLVDYTASGDTDAVTLPTGPPGTLTFAAGQTSATIPVPILVNAIAEPDRNVTVTLSNARSIGPATGANAPVINPVTGSTTTLKIVDDEPRVQFGATNTSVTEGGTATIAVTRTGATSGPVTVNYATGGGTAVANTHYTPVSGTLTFGAGVLSRTFTVTTIDDGVAAGSRTVGLTLSAAVNASIGVTNPAVLTIQDKESAGTFQFAAATGTVVEGLAGDPGRTLRVNVTRTGANLVGPVTIGWSQTGGTATLGTDFSFSPASGTLTFAAGVSSLGFDITAFDDGVAEGTETIMLSLAPPSAGALGPPSATTMTIFIVDAQQSVAFSSPTFTVGETTPQAVITVLRIGVPTGPVTVTATTVPAAVPDALKAIPGTDFQSVTVPLTFGPGEIVKTFTVPIVTSSALIRDGNRVVGLQLVDPPINAALVGTSTAELTILDFRPDLVVASVASPASGIAGKTLPTPTTVKNLGQVASPAFRVGIFMAKNNGSPDDALPGSGNLVMQRDVPALAAGATTSLPTQLAISDDVPAGNYFVSAVANFNQTVTEADSTNNGLSSAPTVLKISSNLSKFQSASASFSLGDTPSSLVTGSRTAGINLPLATPCDVTGSVNLSGSFTITSQQQDTATGTADLSGVLSGGPLNGQPVRFVIAFTGTADASNSITASLTSIVVTGAFSATGGPPTTAPGSFTGVLTGTALTGSASGTLHTSGGGDCAFSGPLTAAAQTSFAFKFATRVPVGFFDFGTTPTVTPAASPSGYAAAFRVLFDSNFPDPSAVRFTGPSGSGLSGTPADPSASDGDDTGNTFTYRSPVRSGIAPGGIWSVLYKGLARTFTVPAFDANRSFVLIVPTVTLDRDGNMAQVDWQYFDSTGRPVGPPPFLGGLRLQIQMNGGGDSQPQSPDLLPTVTSFNFPTAGISPPEWSQVTAVVFQYRDLLGNEYELVYEKTFGVQIQARLENVYQSSQPLGVKQRLITALVNVPFNSVDTTACTDQVTGGFVVSVQNQSPIPRVIPYDAPACLDRGSSTIFPGGTRLIDNFSRQDNLDALALPTLPIGAVFRFNVTVPDPVGTQIVVTSLMNAEANPATDYVKIPNPATPTQKPTGFKLSDAKLGQNLTVSWTLPAFEVGSIQISSNAIVDPPSGQGQDQPPAFTLPAITCGQPSIGLPTSATSATFKLPATCLGAAVTRSQFCVFITGTSDADNKTTAACWFFQ